MKIKSHFVDVDHLTAKIKSVTIRNKTRQAKFSAIGYPPQSFAISLHFKSFICAAKNATNNNARN